MIKVVKPGLFLSLLVVATPCVPTDDAHRRAENVHGCKAIGGIWLNQLSLVTMANCFFLCKNFRPTTQEILQQASQCKDSSKLLNNNDFARYRKYKHIGMISGVASLLSFGFWVYQIDRCLNYPST